jgi:hypothetical protein
MRTGAKSGRFAFFLFAKDSKQTIMCGTTTPKGYVVADRPALAAMAAGHGFLRRQEAAAGPHAPSNPSGAHGPGRPGGTCLARSVTWF